MTPEQVPHEVNYTRQPAPLRARFYNLKMFVAKIICLPLIGWLISLIYKNRIPNQGCIVCTDSDDVLPSVKASLYWGIYEKSERRFVHRYLRSDLDVVELGSSLGVVSSHIRCKLNADRRLVCVEANHNLIQWIKKNTEINSPGSLVKVVHGAIHYSLKPLEYVTFSIDTDNTASRVAEGNSAAMVKVPVFTLSQLLVRCNISHYALVCDIEGAEAGMIECDAQALSCCQQLIIELHLANWNGHQYTVNELRQRLEDIHGFQLRDQYGPVCVFERPNH